MAQPTWRRSVLAAAGIAGALAFPTTDWWPLGWVWLAPVLLVALASAPRTALLDGWLAGTAGFLVLLSWLDHTFRNYSAIPWPLGWLPVGLLAAYCGLYTGLLAWAVARVRAAAGEGAALALSPVFWVAGEWLRGHLFGGFPWGLLGYSQHAVLPVIQVAELGGVYAVSFALVATSAALAAVIRLRGAGRAVAALAGLAVVVGVVAFGLWRLSGLAAAATPERVRIAVIQPSVEQSLKWDPAHRREILQGYDALTREAARSRPALIVWPETAAPIFLRADPALRDDLTRLSAEVGAPLLVGSVDREGERGRFRNSAFLVTPQGLGDRYDKIQLVPFGEYIPLAWLLGFVRHWAEFISEFGAGDRFTVFALPGASFGTAICYEVVFPEIFRGFVVGGAAVMVNITNDAWFGTTSGPWQHLATLPLRAVEHRVAIARSANTGVSAFVEPSGAVAETLGLFAQGTLARSLPRRTGLTVYTRWGDWLPYGCLAASALALFRAAIVWRRRAKA